MELNLYYSPHIFFKNFKKLGHNYDITFFKNKIQIIKIDILDKACIFLYLYLYYF